MLQDNQIMLLQFMAQYPCLDYQSCLRKLDMFQTGDMVAMSYAFRPLTKNGYLCKGKDGIVTLGAKGRQVMSDIQPLVTVGGTTKERVAQVSRMALMLQDEAGIYSYGEIQKDEKRYFIPSACWRRIGFGILSTTRFLGMLMLDGKRYAIYDIGDGHMEWQMRAESSLFYITFEEFRSEINTRANGMIFVCNDDARTAAADNIIRQTMWSRKQLLKEHYAQRDKPTRWSHSPIKLRRQYEHVYLTTPSMLKEDLECIADEDAMMKCHAKNYKNRISDPALGDYEDWPTRCFDNYTTDLLKYVYFLAQVRDDIQREKDEYMTQLTYELIFRKKDRPILRIYRDMLHSVDWVKLYVYNSPKNTDSD